MPEDVWVNLNLFIWWNYNISEVVILISEFENWPRENSGWNRKLSRSGGRVGRWVFVPVCACEEELLGPGKFGRLLWDQGFEYVTGTGSRKKLFGPRIVFLAFVGPGVRICDGDRTAEKNFSGPRKFFLLSWDQGFEYVTGTGPGKKLLGPPKVVSAGISPGVRIWDGDRVVEKTFRASKSFFPLLRNQEWQPQPTSSISILIWVTSNLARFIV